MLQAEASVARDQCLAQGECGDPDWEVDEEDPVPAQGLGQRASGEQTERPAGDGYEHVRAHRPRPVGRLRELGDDDREDHGGLHRRADALDEAGGDQEALTRREPAQRRRGGEHDDPGEKYTPSAEQVPESPGEQQEAAERDEEGVDDPGEIALGEVELALDRGKRHVHDRRVEDDHELREAHDHKSHPAATVADYGERRGGAVHLIQTVEANK